MLRKTTRSSEARWARVASAEDVAPDELTAVSTDRGPVVLARVEDRIYALEDRCSHQDYPLSAGELEDGEVECVFHGARFDLCTGRATRLPAVAPVRTFEVEVRDGGVYLRLE